MVDTKTIQKTREFLVKMKNPVTPSEICKSVNLKWSSVKGSLEFLEKYGVIEIITNGKVMLVRIKKNCEVVK